MAKIPTQTLVTPRFGGSLMPKGAFGDTTQAIANVVGAVGGAVDTVIKMGQDAQQVRNRTQVREKLRELRDMRVKFQNDVLEQNLDPSKWTGEWQTRLGEFEKTIGGKDIPPDVRNALTEKYDDIASSSLLEIAGSALKENRKRAQEVYSFDVNDAAARQDWGESEATIKEAESEGVIDPHQAEMARKALGVKKTSYMREEELTLNPTGYLNDLDAGKYDGALSPVQLFEEREKAEAVISGKARDIVAETRQMFEIGMITTVEEFDTQLSDKPEVDDLTKDVLRKELFEQKKINEPLTYEERFGIADQLSDNFKQLQDGKLNIQEYTVLHNKIQTTLEILGNRPGTGALRERAYRVDPSQFIADDGSGRVDKEAAAKRAAEYKDAELAMEALVRERAGGITAVAVAGKETPEPDDLGGKIDFAKFKTSKQEVEVIFRTEMQKEVRMWANDQDTYPTTPEIKAYMDKIQPDVARRIVADLKAAALDPTKAKAKPPAEEAPVLTPYGNPGNDPGTEEANAAENWMRQSTPGDTGNSLLPPTPRNDQ
jgi:hypothetical protein